MDSSITAIKREKRTLLENHLNESMARYETLFNGNHDAIFALDLDGYFIQVNPSCESMVGFSADELTEMTFQMLVPVEDLHQVFHNFHQTFEGKIQNYDYKITNKSGQLVYLNVTNLPISVNDEIVGVYGIAKDITPFKLKQEGARKTQEIHRLLIENSLDMITRIDLEGNYLYISPACEEILGYTPEEIVNTNVSLFIHYHDRKRANSNQNTLLVHGGNGSDTYRMRKKDGSYIWVESLYKPLIDHETNKVIEVISVTRDITERKKAEDEVRKR
jgi:two-component system, sporulation sensor kinase A